MRVNGHYLVEVGRTDNAGDTDTNETCVSTRKSMSGMDHGAWKHLQSTQEENPGYGEFLRSLNFKVPHDGHGQDQERDIGDDIQACGDEQEDPQIHAGALGFVRVFRPVEGSGAALEGGGEESADTPEESPDGDGIPGDSEAGACGLVHEYTAVEEQDGEFGGCDEDGVGKLDGIHQLDEMNDVRRGIGHGVSSCAEVAALKFWHRGQLGRKVEGRPWEDCCTYTAQSLHRCPNRAPRQAERSACFTRSPPALEWCFFPIRSG